MVGHEIQCYKPDKMRKRMKIKTLLHNVTRTIVSNQFHRTFQGPKETNDKPRYFSKNTFSNWLRVVM